MDVLRSCLLWWPLGSRAPQSETLSHLEGVARISEEQELVIFQDGHRITMTLLETGIRVEKCGTFAWNSAAHIEVVPFLHVLFAEISSGPANHSLFEFSYLSAVTSKFQLRKVSGDVTSIHGTTLLKWVADAQAKSYKDLTPRRRFLVCINPHGGQGKAKQLWRETIEPIMNAAGCDVHVQYTGPVSSPTNAAEIARNLNLTAYDALVPISGDGIVNELLNGLASRSDALTALRMPIAPIPAGSGNALSVNIMGPDKVLDVAYATLNAIKGQPLPLDVCSVTQGQTRTYSFLSQALGLMADLDMGTEWIRWVGGIRFILGFLWGAMTRRRYDIEITLKIVESGKQRMADDYNKHQHQNILSPSAERNLLTSDLNVGMPPLAFGTTESPLPLGVVHNRLEANLEPGWHTFRVPMQFILGGKLPWASRESMTLPLAKNDGLIDVVIVRPRSALATISSLDRQEEGKYVAASDCYYYKVEAYRCTPLERSGYISIDGESIPYKSFQVENHARLARIMSVETRWKGLERVVF
ncbi:ATP-NAD kinase-like domain-containing protein [Mycena metata]|uniref:ATP-NAD kinase-like domain-containing protein n=1 Tax=Mycena metata TaxID=1033252 RepID=A0AAD7MJW3_9AGAR|nr:ATP-NAD kinase-like domain-containing protein [Mycena metata]